MLGPQTIQHPGLSCRWYAWVTRIVIVVAALTFVACATRQNNDGAASIGQRPNRVSDRAVVDCVLPGQIRQLGSQLTYLSAPRVIETSVSDCEIRGGSQQQPPAASAE